MLENFRANVLKLHWSYLKWYFSAIRNEYPEYTLVAAEVCFKEIISILLFLIEHWKSFYLGFT